MSDRWSRPLLRGRRGVVSCGHPLAASAGAAMLSPLDPRQEVWAAAV